ncbi:hypothetical protein OSB04_017896 [Centaurea solstitialis]|uniref:Alcohol dehydrogenase-like N-terminal domain-containing protein n=1 Tax=Centaurea solstitialis TaxID=347529 RepID=A0AA38WMF8_9ASTR|nr:hypothetical protein OSB04_017896 [Centaurea solstitialis]
MDGKTFTSTAGKPIRCRAAIARKAGEPLVIEEVIVAPPKPREVRIRIICTSLCQSDVTFWKLEVPPAVFPRIFGHEAVGVVESVGEGVHEVVEGDTVIPIFLPDCGDCIDCLSDRSNLCTKLPFSVSPWMHRDETSRFTDSNGETLYHFLFISSFSEYTVVDIAHITKIDPAIPPNRACLLSCGISTGVGAAWKTAKVEAGSTVAIFGLGAIGLAVAEGARLCGAKRIIGIDVNPDKFELGLSKRLELRTILLSGVSFTLVFLFLTGKKFGVTDFVNSRNCGDKSVSQAEVRTIASSALGWGKTVVLGVDHPEAMVSLSSFEVLHSGKSLMGSFFGGLKPKSDIKVLEKRYKDKELQLDEFVTHEVEFDDINKAFELHREGKSLRCVIWMKK